MSGSRRRRETRPSSELVPKNKKSHLTSRFARPNQASPLSDLAECPYHAASREGVPVQSLSPFYSGHPMSIEEDPRSTMSSATVKAVFCSIQELQIRGRITRWMEELRDEITAIRSEDELHVFSSICPHFGGEFDFAAQEGTTIQCKWHAWRFDIRTAECTTYNIKTRIRKYEYVIERGLLVVCSQ